MKAYDNLPDALRICVFSTMHLKGSIQFITFVSSKSLLEKTSCHMLPNIDYTLAYFDGINQVDVIWKNHQNIIQFCGSAAYGISHYLLHTLGLPNLSIRAPNLTLKANNDSDVTLKIPAKKINLHTTNFIDLGRLYHHQESGIYFLEVDNKSTLERLHWTVQDLYALPLEDSHGFCVFHWQSSTNTGYVRYFTPWHGRNEDSVTASIQSYLTPFIAYKHGIYCQSWYQLSRNGGHMKTSIVDDKVHIQGRCTY
jgi:predicted PhzF superfamily epimerase YddE/YHI9